MPPRPAGRMAANMRAPRTSPPPSDPRRAGRALVTSTVLLLAAGVLAVAYLRRDRRPAAGQFAELPNIVLVTVDTLRVDHLSCYGHFRETSPALDALAKEGVLVERALSTSGTTLPSHLSILTGLYPHQHGYLSNSSALNAPFKSVEGRSSVARYLARAGYQTAAFVSGPTVSSKTGIADGFELFDDHDPSAARDFHDRSRAADDTTERVLEWLAGRELREPFFLWVHYWDPHEPNIPDEPHASMFSGDERVEALLDARRVNPERLAQRFPPIELSRLFAPDLTPRISAGEEVELPPIDRQALRDLIDLYDGDVRAVDDQFGRLLGKLRERGLWDRTIVAFTSDHGQSLGQHDWLEHGQIQQDNIHVPLVLRFPGTLVPQPLRLPGPVSLIDLLPTLVARLPAEEAREFLLQAEGRDFLSRGFDRPFAFAQRSVRDRKWEPGLMFALRTPEWTYYHFTEAPDRLYRIEIDPLEQSDLAAEYPAVVEELRKVVVSILNRRPYRPAAGEAETIGSPEYRDALKALGYISDDSDGQASGKDR